MHSSSNIANVRSAIAILLVALSVTRVGAQTSESRLSMDGADTLRYTYTPLVADTVVAEPVRKGFLHRVVDYFGTSTVDRTYEKKLDITFAGGPSYSKTTKLGLGVLAAGLYRLDRSDSITSPSDVSIFANVSTSGFFSFGVTGNNIFRQNRRRIGYDATFVSAPREIWGIGYADGRNNPSAEFVEEQYQVDIRYLEQVVHNGFIGAVLDFSHTNGRDFNEVSLSYIYGQKRNYTVTGFGLVLEYDSRDFIPNPARGLYFSVQEVFYPRGLGNCVTSLWRTIFQANAYQRLWRGGLLAFDLYGEFNSDGTPWPLLARLGGNERMRGYYEGQYTDNNMITLQLELRQHIWRRIGCVVWGGAGNVFPDIEKCYIDHTLPNYGIGVRWELKKRVNVRMDYGFGLRTSGFLLSINEAF